MLLTVANCITSQLPVSRHNRLCRPRSLATNSLFLHRGNSSAVRIGQSKLFSGYRGNTKIRLELFWCCLYNFCNFLRKILVWPRYELALNKSNIFCLKKIIKTIYLWRVRFLFVQKCSYSALNKGYYR